MAIVERRRPRVLVQQRETPGELPPHLGGVAGAPGLGHRLVDLVELRLQLAFRLRRRLLRVVAHRQRVDVGQRQREREGRDQKNERRESLAHGYCPNVNAINSAEGPPPAATTRYCLT